MLKVEPAASNLKVNKNKKKTKLLSGGIKHISDSLNTIAQMQLQLTSLSAVNLIEIRENGCFSLKHTRAKC